MKKLTFIFLCLSFISCEENLNIDIPRDKSRLSISSNLMADDYFNGQNSYVYVSNSISALESNDNFDYTDSFNEFPLSLIFIFIAIQIIIFCYSFYLRYYLK